MYITTTNTRLRGGAGRGGDFIRLPEGTIVKVIAKRLGEKRGVLIVRWRNFTGWIPISHAVPYVP